MDGVKTVRDEEKRSAGGKGWDGTGLGEEGKGEGGVAGGAPRRW